MNCFSYVIARDYGFAPNPFGKYCTLATCKPDIRKNASVGDWVVGTGSATYNLENRLVFAMCITEKLTYNQYWEDKRFNYKKPSFNGSLKQTYGDNIYYYDSIKKEWFQANSHHSFPGGEPNIDNLRRDTQSDSVLISDYFWYFGGKAIQVPEEYRSTICKNLRGYKKAFPPELVDSFLQWLKANYTKGYRGDPLLFTSFERYDGIS